VAVRGGYLGKSSSVVSKAFLLRGLPLLVFVSSVSAW